IYYYNHFIGKRRLDLIVEDNVLIEIKAISQLEEGSISQVLNYLNIFEIEVGLLLNFGEKSLRFKRFINTKKSIKSI
ncbi:MAG: GxxExxY protein, partial [Flavisolibacter sp.]